MKKLMKLCCALMMIVLLTGCVKMNINVEIKADKSMTFGMEYLVDEEMVKMSGEKTDDFLKQMKDQVLKNDQMKNAKTETITKTIDDKKWVGLNITTDSLPSTTQNIIQEKEIDGVKSFVLTLPKDELENQMDLGELESYGYSISQLKTLGVEMNVTIKMPGKVTANYGKVNANSVTIDLLDIMTKGQTEDIVISSPIESESSMGMIAMIVVGVIVVGAIIFVITKKKKAKPEEQTVENNEQSVEEIPVVEENKTEE